MLDAKPNQMTHYLIYSTFVGELNEDLQDFFDEMQYLRDMQIPFKIVMGNYEGSRELSFMVDAQYSEIVLNRAFLYNVQDSVLKIEHEWNNKRKATLIFENGDEKPLGYYKKVNKKMAMEHDSWTYDSEECEYYVCEDDELEHVLTPLDEYLLENYHINTSDIEDLNLEEYVQYGTDWAAMGEAIAVAEGLSRD